MDGVSWSSQSAQESFSRTRTTTETLSRLATFIARAETKQQARGHRQQAPPSLYSCQECGLGFSFTTDLLQHQDLGHTLPKPHRCPSCGQEFSLKSSLQLHKCSQDSPTCECCHREVWPGSPCPACSIRTSDPGKQSPHRQPHLLDSSPYACAPCGRGFNQKQALLHHQQAGCSEPPSPSGIVGTSSLPEDSPTLSEGNSLRSDSSDTPGPSRNSMCPVCSRTFRTEVALLRHEQAGHQDEQANTQQGQETKEGDSGREEGKGGAAKVKLDTVKFSKSKRQLLSCRSCDMVFRSTSKLYVHRKEKHSREKTSSKEQRPVASKRRKFTYPCQLCGKIFFHHLSLRAHYRQHAASGLPAIRSSTKDCQSLGKRPKKEDKKTVRAGPGRPRKVPRLERVVREPETHRETAEEEGEEVAWEFPCPSCAEVFSLQSQLREHIELHQSSVRRRQCSVCSQEMDTCRWPSSRKQRLYHCVPCQQGFSALDSFLEHCQEHLRVRVEEDSVAESYARQASKAHHTL